MHIYLSSTSADLAGHRRKVTQLIRLLGHTPVHMEDYTASQKQPISVCLNDVAKCDLFLLLVGFRYGTCPDGQNTSFTELEYRKAVHDQKRRLVFVLEDNDVANFDLGERIAAFRRELLEQKDGMVGLFKSEDELGEKVSRAIREISAEEVHPPVAHPPLIKVERLPETPATLYGREQELSALDAAWDDRRVTAICIVGFAGSGKSSLLNCWLNRVLTSPEYCGAEAILGWSFYAGGAGVQQSSADSFVEAAFQWFREEPSSVGATPDTFKVPGNPWDKGRKLADLIHARRTLLLLDGLEVINDVAMKALLKSLAPRNSGLCVITSRQPVEDLQSFVGGPVRELHLSRLTTQAGIQLLTSLGVRDPLDPRRTDAELAATVEEYWGHPLSLRLVGNLLKKYCRGNVRDRTRLGGAKLSDVISGLLTSYEAYLGDSERELLRMLSVFRGPAPRRALNALRSGRQIDGLTEHASRMSELDWNAVIEGLIKLELITENQLTQGQAGIINEADGDLLDTHALIREHFIAELQTDHHAAWVDANNRLFEFYRRQAPPLPEDFGSMVPLFRAVAHGCQAGRYQEAWDQVEWKRIRREDSGFAVVNLGAWSEDLVSLTNFFTHPWDLPAEQLDPKARAWLLTETAFDLRGVSRLNEAVAPMKEGLRGHIENEDWWAACDAAGNLSELLILFGDLEGAADAATQSVVLAEKAVELATSPEQLRQAKLTLATNVATVAEVSHQQGRVTEAKRQFEEAESIYVTNETSAIYAHVPLKWLHRARGFHFCDLLLEESPAACADSEERAAEMIRIDQMFEHRKYPDGLGMLVQALASMIRHRNGESVDLRAAQHQLQAAEMILREAGFQPYVVRVRIAAAMLRFYLGELSQALADLDEAIEATARGQMRLLNIDALLEKTRVLLAMDRRVEARLILEQAAREVNAAGYHRRDTAVAELQRACADVRA